MTHKDIYTKFMIEYDKANVTSSYPSLTEYEVATVLDKAYNALIAQKITGNNIRRALFETDVKAIADLEPLVRRTTISTLSSTPCPVTNGMLFDVPDEMLYFVQAYGKQYNFDQDGVTKVAPLGDSTPQTHELRDLPVMLVSHEMATRFFATAYNLPWIKIPVCFIEDGKICVVHDPIKKPEQRLDIVYIKKPNTFVKNIQLIGPYASFFDSTGASDQSIYNFECNSTVAEELISLAVAFALENVESQRLNSKLNMRGLEA